ncbi:fibronectin type-III domain-containing protein 3A-like isoform X2 [Penaeus japonicus]|uniref:fibronectin type-III domain-containing protein 3A-like isoform X2 n=1 Tax=Penaeus japonicus TaxID=27405 RepID=UPI001C716F45|nr:fibronectin type-III domain-containing protein 3A-like isoform X2 [Penaeus japonicus]
MVLSKGQEQAPDKDSAVSPASHATDPGAVTSQFSAEETRLSKVMSADSQTTGDISQTITDDFETTHDVADPDSTQATIANSKPKTAVSGSFQTVTVNSKDSLIASAELEAWQAKSGGAHTTKPNDHSTEHTPIAATSSEASRTVKSRRETIQTVAAGPMISQSCSPSTVSLQTTNSVTETSQRSQTTPKKKTKRNGGGKSNQKEETTESAAEGSASGSTGTTGTSKPSPPMVLRVKGPDGQVTTFMLVGPNAGQGPPQFFGPPPAGPPPQGYVPPYQPPPQYSPVVSPPLTQASPPPHYTQKSERHMRQYEKPRKYYQRQPQHQHVNKSGSSSLHSTPPLSPKKELLPRKIAGDEEIHAEDGEDPRNNLHLLLSQVKPPKVINLTPFEAVLQWSAPELSNQQQEEIPVSELLYEVFLNNSLHKSIAATQLTISGLKPATEYRVYLQCVCGGVRGDPTNVTPFHTHSTVPDTPQQPRLSYKTKTSLQFRWSAVKENGSRVTAFVLELYGGSGGKWEEVFRGRGKQHSITKLTPNTRYHVRLAAVNDLGQSDFSPEAVAFTSGVAPSQPSPPSLEQACINSLSLGWSKQPLEESFTLQMEDSLNGYGFRPVYNGTDTKYECQGLRRNADYKFRLFSHNDEGTSHPSDIVCYRTLPDRPKPPTTVSVKGRPKSSKLLLTWSPPADHGGSTVTDYRLEIDRGSGFELIYSGKDTEFECCNLEPGKSYQVRVLCISLGGLSDWSETAVLTTEAVHPGICQPPHVLGKPKASMLQLKWAHPDYNGGAPVTEFQVEMTAPDNERRQVYCGRDLECTVASLLPGRPYIFLVRCVNRMGPGPWSEPLEVVSGAGPPDAPHSLHLACRGPHSVHLAWEEPINNGAAIEQYSVQVAEVSCPHAESSESSSTCGDPESDLTFNNAYTGSAPTAEVRNLAPATTYAFRVSCSNSAGVGPWSSISTVTTPAAPPAPVAYISSSPAATSMTLLWGEPANHGDPITHYVIEIGDRTITTPGPETEYTIEDLMPETLYKVRIQAINSVGPGGLSTVHKVTTRPHPPTPPTIELVRASYNSLRLKWGDGRNSDLLVYSLQMEFPNPHSHTTEFYQVYNGTNQNFKVVRLEENTLYRLRICANNEAGVGPYSPVVELRTTKAPPPPPKAPRVTEVADGNHLVEWCSVRCPGEDSIMYRLQVLQAGKDQDYSTVFTGSETSYELRDLEPHSGYFVRVCGVRVCSDGEKMAGAYSSPMLFNTPKPPPVTTMKTSTNPTQDTGLHWHRLSDQNKAFAILLVFSIFCAIAAIGLHHFVAPNSER